MAPKMIRIPNPAPKTVGQLVPETGRAASVGVGVTTAATTDVGVAVTRDVAVGVGVSCVVVVAVAVGVGVMVGADVPVPVGVGVVVVVGRSEILKVSEQLLTGATLSAFGKLSGTLGATGSCLSW